MSFDVRLAAAMSGRRSPLQSPTVTLLVLSFVAIRPGAAKCAVPSPRKTFACDVLKGGMMLKSLKRMSSCLAPLKSATATELGPVEPEKCDGEPKPPEPLPRKREASAK